MAEDLINQGGVCSGNWWHPSMKPLLTGGFSPCSGMTGDMASFNWSADSSFGPLTSSTNSDLTQAFLFGGGASNQTMSLSSNSNNIMHESGSSDSSSPESALGSRISFPTQTIPENFANPNIVSSSCGYPSTMINPMNFPDMDYYGSGCPGDSFGKLSRMAKPMNSPVPNPNHQPSRLHFSNNTPYWNASMSALDDIRSALLDSPRSSIFVGSSLGEKPNRSNLITKGGSQYSQQVGSVKKKVSSEPVLKRPRTDQTPSPLPTFKVRKEKLGDRITALQQLVSPFGKTDTASVLHEAIECIKFLHDQINALSTPYMKNGAPFQHQQASVAADRALKDKEGPKMDLRSRGLCLVPTSSTFPVTNEAPAEFWTPTFGVSFH